MTKMFKKLISAQLLLSLLLSSCSQPLDEIKDRTWTGELIRKSDDKPLSLVKLKMKADTLYIFANAIFGSQNDTLLMQKFDKSDSTLTYVSPNGDNFSLRIKYNETKNSKTLLFIGNDFYINLSQSIQNLTLPGALDFYQDKIVPRESYMYLDGAYQGKMEMENQLSNMYLEQMGGFTFKFVFMDNNKIRIYFKNPMVELFSGTEKAAFSVANYRIEGHKLFINYAKFKTGSFEVKQQGEILVFATNDANIILHKLY